MIHARIASPEDKDAIYRVWKVCFGDTDEYIDGFFSCLYKDGNSLVIEDEQGVFGMSHLIPLGEMTSPKGERVPCAVTYALGVEPRGRGNGGGAILTAKTMTLAEEKGYLPLICPAEPSLFDYYGARTSYETAFFADEAVFSAENREAEVSVLSTGEYLSLREKLLEKTAHIALSADIMDYQQRLCRASGGGLYSIRLGDETAIAAVEGRSDSFAKELLTPSDTEKFAAALAHRLGAPFLRARFPGSRPFAMAVKSPVFADGAWFGFAFD